MTLVEKCFTALRDPALAYEYACYLANACISAGNPTRSIEEGVRIAGFTGFSEFRTCTQCISDDELAFFRALEIKRGVIIDVGANLGIVAITLSRLYPGSRIFAFEPNPSTYAALISNIERNFASNVRPQQFIVSDSQRGMPFVIKPGDRATCSIATSGCESSQLLPSTTLDIFTREHQIESIEFLKVDVEGYESLVFGGAHELLSRGAIKTIYFEHCPALMQDAGIEPTRPVQMLLGYGYKLFAIHGKDLQPGFPERNSTGFSNWVARRE